MEVSVIGLVFSFIHIGGKVMHSTEEAIKLPVSEF
jgi:hypothetical protein